MAKKDTLQGVGIIRTYARLHEIFDEWVSGETDRLAIVSRGGLGKSRLHTDHNWRRHPRQHKDLGGDLSAAGLFDTLCSLIDTPPDRADVDLIFDDIETMLRNGSTRNLMKQIAATETVRRVDWKKRNQPEGNPESVFLTGKVCMLLNDLPAQNPNVAAVCTRFKVVYFDPDRVEIINEAKKFVDPDDVDFVASHPIKLDLRMFWHWKSEKASKLDEIQFVRDLMQLDGDQRHIINVLESHKGRPVKDQISAFAKMRGSGWDAAKMQWHRKSKELRTYVEAAADYRKRNPLNSVTLLLTEG